MTAPRDALAELRDDMAEAFGGDEAWLTTGTKVADLVRGWLEDWLAEQRADAVRVALGKVERRIAADFPLNGELRPDGTEDPQAAAYVEGLNVAWNLVQEVRAELGGEGRG